MVSTKEDAEEELKNRLEEKTDFNILDVTISNNPIYTVTVEGTIVSESVTDICKDYLGYESVSVKKVKFTDEYDEAMQATFYMS